MVQTSLFAFFPSMEHFVFHPVRKQCYKWYLAKLKFKRKHDRRLNEWKNNFVITLEIHLNSPFTMFNFRYFNFLCNTSSNIVLTKKRIQWTNVNKITLLLTKVAQMKNEENIEFKLNATLLYFSWRK